MQGSAPAPLTTYAAAIAMLDRLANFEREGGWTYDTELQSGAHACAGACAGRPGPALSGGHRGRNQGEGSTSAMLAAILAAAGRKVGLYTSPHLIEWRSASGSGWTRYRRKRRRACSQGGARGGGGRRSRA